MGRLTPDEFRKKYAELPPNLREAYGSVKTTEILEEIGKKHGLRIDQIGELVDETGYVMLGATPPSDYVMKLEGAVGVSRDKAKAVALDVNEQVFKPIRDALKRVHKVGEYRNIPPKEMPTPAPIEEAETAPASAETTEAPPPKEYAPASVPITEPPPTPVVPAPPRNLSEERLTTTFSLPREEKTYAVSEDGAELKETDDKKYVLDPYREPVE